MLPTVLVPVCNARLRLDTCLASLERTLPSGAAVLIADDASSDPQIETLARAWCDRSNLAATYARSESRVGLAANCNAGIDAIGDADVVLLMPDAIATSGWLQQLARCAAADPVIASVTPWSNNADLCSFPRFAEENPAPAFPETLAEATAGIVWGEPPELPVAVGSCVLLTRTALKRCGGLDAHSFAGARALDDFCRRAAAMGWRNVLCPSAFVVRDTGEEVMQPDGGELARLAARWPDYQQRMAMFILSDPLRGLRERVQARVDELARSGPQRDLFH